MTEVKEEEKNTVPVNNSLDQELLQELKTVNTSISDLLSFLKERDQREIIQKNQQEEQAAILKEQQTTEEAEVKKIQEEQARQDKLADEVFQENLLNTINDVSERINEVSGKEFTVNNADLPAINTNLEKLITPIESTQEELSFQKASNYADVGIVLLVFVLIPIMIVIKFSTSVFNRWLTNIF